MRVPTELIPRCPRCGKPVVPNLRADDKFVEDDGWHTAAARYQNYLQTHKGRVLYLELAVGFNTPSIIKYSFWRLVAENPAAIYACVNRSKAFAPEEIAGRSICINGDVAEIIKILHV